MDPTISVLLPVYNASEYLEVALRSIVDQTRGDMEIIIIDDGSTDSSAAIVRSFDDSRIRLFQQENKGLAWTLNRAASLARGRYLARMDADDIALPRRFELQAAYLDAHPQVFLLGTAAEIWAEDQPSGRLHCHPTEPLVLAFEQLFDNHFVHSSVMLRRELFDTVGGYRTEKERQPEDFELWSRVLRQHQAANLPDVLQVYRERAGSICRTGVHPFRDRVIRMSAENLGHACGLAEPAEVHRLVASLTHGVVPGRVSAAALREAKSVVAVAAENVATTLGEDPRRLDEAVQRRCDNLVGFARRGSWRGLFAGMARRTRRLLTMRSGRS